MFKVLKIFTDLKHQLVKDFEQAPLVLSLEILGTLSSLVGAFTIAFYGKDADLSFAFSGYLIGAIILTITAYMRSNSFLILLNIGYAIVNILYFLRH